MLLKAEGIHKKYRNGNKDLEVLKGIGLSIDKSEIVAIIGPSGAGKSTLLHILAGLDTPCKGKVNFDGTDLYGLSDEKRAFVRNRKMGFVFQYYHLMPEFSAMENIIMPAMISRGRSSRDKRISAKAKFLIEEIGIKRRAGHKPSQLSGGEAQRVAIARALINEPEIVFCDEPTGNLDSENAGLILKLIRGLNRDAGQAFLMVTHNEKVAGFADRILHIEDGKMR